MTQPERLVIGIDGGGTATRAVLASFDGAILGRGEAGPGNPKAVGLEQALSEVRQAIDAAFLGAGLETRSVEAICLALAGAGRPEDRPPIESWVAKEKISIRSDVVPDALAVLAAASPSMVGISLIAGTGSMAYGRDATGAEARVGGWGHLFGDEGSGYALALAGLRAAVQSADGRGPSTKLLPAFLDRLKIHEPSALVTTLYSPMWDRRRISELAAVVATTAEWGDDIGLGLLQEAADELTKGVIATADRLTWESPPTVALTGGLIANAANFRGLLEESLNATGKISKTTLVTEPALGAVAIAQRLASERVSPGEP
jgi:N-acetylglucosamine kinase-like BadF-type ATPase